MFGLELSRKLWKEESVGRGSEEFKGGGLLASVKGEGSKKSSCDDTTDR